MCQHCHCRIHPQNSGEQNTSHSKRLRSLRGAESEADEMIKQEQLRPLQLSGAPQTSETIPAHPHSGFFFHHFFLFFYEFIKFSWKTLSDLIFFVFIATASGFRIPAQKEEKRKKKRKQNLKKIEDRPLFTHTMAKKVAKKNIVPEEMKKC